MLSDPLPVKLLSLIILKLNNIIELIDISFVQNMAISTP